MLLTCRVKPLNFSFCYQGLLFPLYFLCTGIDNVGIFLEDYDRRFIQDEDQCKRYDVYKLYICLMYSYNCKY